LVVQIATKVIVLSLLGAHIMIRVPFISGVDVHEPVLNVIAVGVFPAVNVMYFIVELFSEPPPIFPHPCVLLLSPHLEIPHIVSS